MPANLPPDYYAAEERFRAAASPQEKIVCLEEMLSIMPKHKGTDKLQADIRKRISKLKTQSESKKSASRGDPAYKIEKEGAGQVMMAGPANVGKSSLMAALTNAHPEIADFPGTTRKPLPGIIQVNDIQVQLIDSPAVNIGYLEPEMLDLIRRADGILMVVDLTTDPESQIESTADFLYNQRVVAKHLRHTYDAERLLFDMPFVVAANKNDDESSDENVTILQEFIGARWNVIPVSATTGRNLDTLKDALVRALKIIRVYSKPRGKEADMTEPFTLKQGATVQDFANKVHKDFVDKLKNARIWGTNVYDGQMAPRGFILHDGDIVELHI